MEVHQFSDNLVFETPTVVTLGTFDGLHLGHQKIISDVVDEAVERGAESVVVTFDRHPAELLRPENVPYFLTSFEDKVSLIAACGIDHLLVIPFDQAESERSAEDFVREILIEKLSTELLIVGHDVHFGNNREGNFSFLERVSKELDFEIRKVDPVMLSRGDSEAISSTAIRRALRGGEVESATQMLGRPYSISGEVVYGDQRGRTIGFPTANLVLSSDRAWPADGVYAGIFTRTDASEHMCAINVGRRPTFYEHADTSLLEAHLLDFDDDLYGEICGVSFLYFLRSEKRFDGIDSLVEQLKDDVAKTRSLLS
ncbi:MAG: bifunctional riboflavin kinase/FAD synthetase [Actinomycetota bacterium]|nr:bifunctional riboflavin kinase/FAD synthetase [Actinomycetota bacterium]